MDRLKKLRLSLSHLMKIIKFLLIILFTYELYLLLFTIATHSATPAEIVMNFIACVVNAVTLLVVLDDDY